MTGYVIFQQMLSIEGAPLHVAWQIALTSAAMIRKLCDMLDTDPYVVLQIVAMDDDLDEDS